MYLWGRKKFLSGKMQGGGSAVIGGGGELFPGLENYEKVTINAASIIGWLRPGGTVQ